MNFIDLLIIIPLAYGSIRGFFKGFIIEGATFVGLLLGLFVAIKYSDLTESFLRDFLDITTSYVSYIALATTFLIVMIVVYILGKIFTYLIEFISLGLVNKILGSVLGLVKSTIFVLVIVLLVNAVDDNYKLISKETKSNSLLYGPSLEFAESVYKFIRY